MNTTPIAQALRARAAAIKAAADKRVDETGRIDADTEDTIELIRVLARLCEGIPLAKAFGAPGDWGGEIETALRELHR